MNENELIDIPGYNGDYKITRNGEVWSFKLEKPKNLTRISQVFDYDIVNLSLNGKPTTFFIHHLVMSAFGPQPPKDYVITHKDTNKKNNHISNLKWIHKKDVRHRTANPVKAVGVDDGDIVRFRTTTLAARYFHSNAAIIRRMIDNKKVYKGYLFTDIKNKQNDVTKT